MKPKNFPARKKERQILAQRDSKAAAMTAVEDNQINQARQVRTKKDRSNRFK